MMMGFGFCPNCGTPRVAAEQRFCAGCGLALAAASPPAPQAPVPIAAPVSVSSDLKSPIPPPPASERIAAAEAPSAPPPWAAQPVVPPAWSMPPAAAPTAPPWAVPPAAPGVPAGQAAPPVYLGAPAPTPTPRVPGAPIATVAGIKVTPKLLAIGGIVLAVVVAVVYMSMGSKSGSIAVTPSTFSCSSSTQVTSVMQLPSSMKATDKLSWQADGVSSFTNTVADTFKLQSDGSWLATDTSAASSSCQGASGPMSMGAHTIRILDANGRVLAEGSFTLTP
jgi:hypothetical protein